jgi:hypothetical protein
MSTITEAVKRWWNDNVAYLDRESPVQVHLDALLGDAYQASAAATIGTRAYHALLAEVGDLVVEYRPVAQFYLPGASEFVVDAPNLDSLDALVDTFRPPSLVVVSRQAFGRSANLMEEYHRPLRTAEPHKGAYLVWSYRTWRVDMADDEYWRAVSLEHFLDVPEMVFESLRADPGWFSIP